VIRIPGMTDILLAAGIADIILKRCAASSFILSPAIISTIFCSRCISTFGPSFSSKATLSMTSRHYKNPISAFGL
jgi:hypothetical protein